MGVGFYVCACVCLRVSVLLKKRMKATKSVGRFSRDSYDHSTGSGRQKDSRKDLLTAHGSGLHRGNICSPVWLATLVVLTHLAVAMWLIDLR